MADLILATAITCYPREELLNDLKTTDDLLHWVYFNPIAYKDSVVFSSK